MKMYDTVELKEGAESVSGFALPAKAQGVIMEFTQSSGPGEEYSALVEFDLQEYPAIPSPIQIVRFKHLALVS